MNHAISINSDKTLVITLPEGTQVDRVMIRKMGTQESKLYWRDEVLDQYKWERDIAIQQLKELGYGFGQEPKRDGDTISRQAAIETLKDEWAGVPVYYLRGDDVFEYSKFRIESLPSVQPERMVLPEICIVEGYDTIEDENGNKGFGVYIPSKKQIYVAGDVPQEIMLKTLFHELTHWVQDISGREFDEDEANLLAERVYDALPHDMRGEEDG